MNVSLSEVKRAARAHRAPLAGESAGYLVLALADQVLNAPRVVTANDVQLGEDGALRIVRGEASSESDAELSLRRALDELLLVASSGSAALMRAGRRAAPIGLAALVKELEAALIPVNRAAAKRALSRLQRETARALANGQLPDEVPERPAPAVSAPPAEVVPVPAEPSQPAKLEPWLPPALSSLDGIVTVANEEPAFELSPTSSAPTIALELAAPAEVELSEDEIEIVEEDPNDALTLARNVEVLPASVESVAPSVDMPADACTKPEPVIVRKSLRPLVPEAVPLPPSPLHTPALGSLVRELPVLTPERIAELSAIADEEEGATQVFAPVAPLETVMSEEIEAASSPLSIEECTEPMPAVEPLCHGVSIVPTHKSDVSELLAGFQVASDENHRGLCRAIKDLAELDLTPAPFTALIR